jgi:hypothetical protein
MAAVERVAQRPQEIAELVAPADEPGTFEHLGEGLLNEVLGVVARSTQRAGRAVQPVDVVSQMFGVEWAG